MGFSARGSGAVSHPVGPDDPRRIGQLGPAAQVDHLEATVVGELSGTELPELSRAVDVADEVEHPVEPPVDPLVGVDDAEAVLDPHATDHDEERPPVVDPPTIRRDP